MRYQYASSWSGGDSRAFFEKAFRRRSLADWDAKWQQLTVEARHSFLHQVKLPEKNPVGHGNSPSAPANDFPPQVLEELNAAGFVKIELARSKAMTDRVFAAAGTHDFAWRGRTLRRLHLLDSNQPSEFSRYVDEVFYGFDLLQTTSAVLCKVGFEKSYYQLDELLGRHVNSHRWQDWVVQALDDALAKTILKRITDSVGEMLLVDLCGQIEGSKPQDVRLVVDQLITYLVLVEDFRRDTWELIVGFPPTVREKMARTASLASVRRS